MATSNTTLPTIYPEDEELLSQLASLQDMYNQVREPTDTYICVITPA